MFKPPPNLLHKRPGRTCRLDKRLIEAQEGGITSDDLLETLMSWPVFMPVQYEKPAVPNIHCSNRAQPLVLTSEDGLPLQVLFSRIGFDLEPETVNEQIGALNAGRTRH